jgi:hypothetical protein
MAILSKAMYMFEAIPIKIPMTSISEIEKSNFIWKHKKLQNGKGNTEQKGQYFRYHKY